MYNSEVVQVNDQIISEALTLYQREQIQYNEYTLLSEKELLTFQANKLKHYASDNESLSYALVDESKILGIITCVKDNFDSQHFNMDCYRVTELSVFQSSFDEVRGTLNKLVNQIEGIIKQKSNKSYIALSTNNNLSIQNLVFNSLTELGFYYIHSLLTFSYSKSDVINRNNSKYDGIIIRHAIDNDAFAISELAGKSFKFSRFHLDPHLDNDKANKLLMESAANSILHDFVDVMFVAECEGRVVGYYSGKKKRVEEFGKTVGDVVISAIDSNFRGLGIFSALDNSLLSWFADNTDFAEMGTYLANYPVHRTWISKGLKLIRGMHQFSKLVL